MIERPRSGEYGEYYGRYIGRVPEDSDVLAVMAKQADELRSLLAGVSEEQADVRPAEGEWSVKEVIGHVNDTERVFAYRAMCIARGESAPLPGFDQDDYVRATDFNKRTLADLLDEFELQRRANILCFKPLSTDESSRTGIASNVGISARACIYVLAGHVMHHYESLKVDYKVQG